MPSQSTHSSFRKDPEHRPEYQLLTHQDRQQDIERKLRRALAGLRPLYRRGEPLAVSRPQESSPALRIRICDGAVCRMAGAQEGIRDFLDASFPGAAFEHIRCLGRCHENRAFQYNGVTFSGGDIDRLEEIREGFTGHGEYRLGSYGRSVLVRPTSRRINSLALLGLLLNSDPMELLGELEASRFRCRGQSGEPMVEKMLRLYYADGDDKLIVCHAGAGDPGSYADRFLLEQRSKRVLWGMILAGYITGAREGVVYLSRAYPRAVAQLEISIREMEAAGLLGVRLFGSAFRFDIHLIIQGEQERAATDDVLSDAESLLPMPLLAANPETFSNFLPIYAMGGENFARIGTPLSSGTKLWSLDSSFRKPGIYEVEMGTPLRVLTDSLGGGFRKPVKALHVGGRSGAIIPTRLIDTLRIDYETFGKKGIVLSCNSIIGIPEDYSVEDYLADFERDQETLPG